MLYFLTARKLSEEILPEELVHRKAELQKRQQIYRCDRRSTRSLIKVVLYDFMTQFSKKYVNTSFSFDACGKWER